MTRLNISAAPHPLRGMVRVPADKSISHRAAILAALADGDTRIENFLPSQTTHATLHCLRALGVDIAQLDATTLVVRGGGLHSLREPRDVLFCAGSATTLRLMAGVCAGQNFLSILDGTEALKRRPMARVVEPLRAMGATILAREDGRLPPLAIRGGALRGIEYTLNVASAQVKSAILLAALFADTPTIVREPAPSRDHTERMLRTFGLEIHDPEHALRIQPTSNPATLRQACGLAQDKVYAQGRLALGTGLRAPTALSIPRDFSSAAFFIVAALLVPGSELCLERVGINATRTGLLDALARMGACVRIENVGEESGEPVGDVIVRADAELRAVEISGAEVPRMLDEFPIWAVAATQARGESVVRDARELRVKESDRIAALAAELRKMGALMEERADGFVIAGPTRLHGARVAAHNDHRLAMSLAVAALVARGETVIDGWECVMDSFPNFAETLAQLT